jgi:hypothetical protein
MMLIDRRDIAQLQAGPETDALVAAVIGGDVLPYSSTWDGAGVVLDWCHEHDITVSVYTIFAWWSSFQHDRGAKVQGCAGTGPLAICRGLLLWKRAGS